jgi:hypothetical protein
MRGNISVLHAGVSVPASCLPFDVIPSAYLEWYRAVFEEGARAAPPDSPIGVTVLDSRADHGGGGSDHFDVAELLALDGDVVHFFDNIIVTSHGVYSAGRRLADSEGDPGFAVTPRNRHLISARLSGNALFLRDLSGKREVNAEIAAEQVMSCEGRLYAKNGSGLFLVEFVETAGTTTATLKRVGNVMNNATQLFEGVAFQNMLGAYYASLLPAPDGCYQIRIRELDGYQLIDARLSDNVLIVVGTRNGNYDKLILRFAAGFQRYDVRRIADVQFTGINFTVLDTGICLHVTENDELEVFSSVPGSDGMKIVADPLIAGDARLFHIGRQALFARGNKLYRFALHG